MSIHVPSPGQTTLGPSLKSGPRMWLEAGLLGGSRQAVRVPSWGSGWAGKASDPCCVGGRRPVRASFHPRLWHCDTLSVPPRLRARRLCSLEWCRRGLLAAVCSGPLGSRAALLTAVYAPCLWDTAALGCVNREACGAWQRRHGGWTSPRQREGDGSFASQWRGSRACRPRGQTSSPVIPAG